MTIFGIGAALIFAGCSHDSPTKPSYTITVTQGIQNGSITANPASAEKGTTVILTISPDSGYQLKAGSLNVIQTSDGTAVTISGSGNVFTFTMPATDVIVSGEFEPIPVESVYTVMVMPGIQNGSITANPASAAAGAAVNLTISPATGYQLKTLNVIQVPGGTAVSVNGSGNSRTFTMPASNVTVSGEFEPIPDLNYAITVTAGIQNGSITASSLNAEAGATVNLTISPAAGYQLKTLSVTQLTDGTAVSFRGGDGSYRFTMPASPVAVSGAFELITGTSYAVNIISGQGGSVTANSLNAAADAPVSLRVDTASGYQLKSLTIMNMSSFQTIPMTNLDTAYFFIMPASDVTVAVEFERLYTITITLPENGTITANTASAIAGAAVTLTIGPHAGYRLKALDAVQTPEGTAVRIFGTGNSRTFTMPAADVTVSGEFEKLYSVTVTPGIQNGGITANPSANVEPGTVVTLTIGPASGYRLQTGSLSAMPAGGTALTLNGNDSDTIRTFTMPAADVTVSGVFEPIPPNTATVIFEGFGDETIDLSRDTNYDLRYNSGDSLTITVNGSYDYYHWYMNGEHWREGYDETEFTVYSYYLSLGINAITVVVVKDGVPYSKELTIRVVR